MNPTTVRVIPTVTATVEEAEKALRAALRRAEDAQMGVGAARATLAKAKGEPAPVTPREINVEEVISLLDESLTEYIRGDVWLAAHPGNEFGGRKVFGDGLFKSVQWVRDYLARG